MKHVFRESLKIGILLLLFSTSCSKKESINKTKFHPELKKVLEFYNKSNDTSKLKAAHFLISNMDGLGTDDIQLFDETGQPINLYLPSYKNEKALKKAIDSLNIFYKTNFIADIKNISSEQLILYIEEAFQAWENSPFHTNIEFEHFCEYLLPYRVNKEPLENWRGHIRQKYNWALDSINRSKNLREIINLVNSELQSWFSFGKAHFKPDESLSFSDLELCKKGDCEAMSNLTLFTMRALGIAVMKDFTPAWAAANGGHSWNSVYLETGELCSFQGTEGNLMEDRPHLLFPFDTYGNLISDIDYRKSGKVYRNTYSIQKNSLVEIVKNKETIPPFFKKNNRFIDVTNEYMPVKNISLTLNTIPENNSYAYICVFNDGKWKPIHYSEISKNYQVEFSNMGRDIVYLISYYQHGRCIPLTSPFFVPLNGPVEWLTPDRKQLQNLTTRKRSYNVFFDLPKFRISPTNNYRLFVWEENQWIFLTGKKAFSDSLNFHKVPIGGLYQLRLEGSDSRERVFMCDENGNIIWM